MAEDIPFMVTVEIPGVRPSDYIEVQNHLIDVETDFQLIPVTNVPDDDNNNGHLAVLRQKVVAHVLVKVSEWTQIDVVTDVIPSRMLVLGKDHKCSCSSTKVIC
jgi:hypothetical protein